MNREDNFEYGFISPFTGKPVTHSELIKLREKNPHRAFHPFITPFDTHENVEIEEKRKKWIQAWKDLPNINID